ncbi:MAG TPA: hypothetical protein PKV06_11500 [bacterium]|nr:hypothetical protein [bacterium]
MASGVFFNDVRADHRFPVNTVAELDVSFEGVECRGREPEAGY